MGIPRAMRIADQPDRGQARIDPHPVPGQRFEGPFGADGPLGRPKRLNRRRPGLAEGPQAGCQVRIEFFGGQAIDVPMPEAVAADPVTSAKHLLHEVGMTLGETDGSGVHWPE